MEKKYLKKVLAGISITGLLAGAHTVLPGPVGAASG